MKLRPSSISHLDVPLQQAAGEIDYGIRLLTGGQWFKPSQMQRLSRGRPKEWTEAQNALVSLVRSWAVSASKRHLPVSRVIDMVVENKPAWEVERLWRLPSGRASEWLIEALLLYQKMAQRARGGGATVVPLASRRHATEKAP